MARQHEALMARNMKSNRSDMQDKYCGDCYDIHRIKSQYKRNHKRDGAAEGRATSFVVAANGHDQRPTARRGSKFNIVRNSL